MPRDTNFESCYAHFGQLGSQGKMKRTILFVLFAIRTLCQFIVLHLRVEVNYILIVVISLLFLRNRCKNPHPCTPRV
jgi:hypothetical protein